MNTIRSTKLIIKLMLAWFILFLGLTTALQIASPFFEGLQTSSELVFKSIDLDDQDEIANHLKDVALPVVSFHSFNPIPSFENSCQYLFDCAEFRLVLSKLSRGPPTQSL